MISLLFADGVLNWLQNIIAFSVLSLVTPLTYAVASASKRIFVIAVSLFILGNPVTWMNVFGMMLAVLGVLVYNRVSFYPHYDKNTSALLNSLTHPVFLQAKHLSRSQRSAILPTTSNGNGTTTLINSSTWPKYSQFKNDPGSTDPYSPLYRNGKMNNGYSNGSSNSGNLLLNGKPPSPTAGASRLLFV